MRDAALANPGKWIPVDVVKENTAHSVASQIRNDRRGKLPAADFHAVARGSICYVLAKKEGN